MTSSPAPTMATLPVTAALQPLPRPVKPLRNETLDSYLDRLAAANRLHPDALRSYISGSSRKTAPIALERLSLVCAQHRSVLQRALPDLSDDAQEERTQFRRRPSNRLLVRRACRACAATHGALTPARCYLDWEDVVCLRHRRWRGDSHTAMDQQPSLAHQPEILYANRLHRKLIRRRGRAVAEAAYYEANRICEDWRQRFDRNEHFQRLMSGFHGPAWHVLEIDPTVEAATYPQVITITRLLASPEWRELPFGSTDDLARFEAEVRRTAAPRFTWSTTRIRGHTDPLVELFLEEALHRAGPRPYDYRSPIFEVDAPSTVCDGI